MTQQSEWNIPESMIEYEQKIAALERERGELKAKLHLIETL